MNEQTTLPVEQRRGESALGPLFRLRDEIDRLFEDFPFTLQGRSVFAFPPRAAAVMPAMELTETDAGYELSVELPGIEEKDIDIEVADGVLTISGEKREESENKQNGYLLSERRYGSFRRQTTLPADVDPDAIDATFGKGVLRLAMKKDQKAAARARKIKIG